MDRDKLIALRAHLGTARTVPAAAPAKPSRVQKNLSIPAADAERMKGLAARDNLSQAGLLVAALDAYEALHGKRA
ncbi:MULTISPECIES: hypothetical protein [Rhodomicrobium]|uniref:hypothetical protein n=1 Tax=Rhodomicrobium TaxID=1068 RepID=UPI000B4B4FFC|nr:MULTISPECIES: hypothetical protein [Rhodomicrobium]